jgi:hypothetical protein
VAAVERVVLLASALVAALAGKAQAQARRAQAQAGRVEAQSTIHQEGARPAYAFEAEPHLVLGPLDPPGIGAGTGIGLGARGTVELLPDGFISSINDSVGVGFGFDWIRYDGGHQVRGACENFAPGPNGTLVCTEVRNGSASYWFFPVVMQWNFWLTRKWSVFGEPGVLLYVAQGSFNASPFALYAGGRLQLSDAVTLTLRIGYPTFSFGVSFLL